MCIYSDAGTKFIDLCANQPPPSPSYECGSWTPTVCSVTCGTGVATTKNVCYPLGTNNERLPAVPPHLCGPQCVDTTAPCVMPPCPVPQCERERTVCSVSCGTGVTTIQATCMAVNPDGLPNVYPAQQCGPECVDATAPCRMPECYSVLVPFCARDKAVCELDCASKRKGRINQLRKCVVGGNRVDPSTCGGCPTDQEATNCCDDFDRVELFFTDRGWTKDRVWHISYGILAMSY